MRRGVLGASALAVVVIATAAWLLWPSKGGETADAIADYFDGRGCSEIEREDAVPADLPGGFELAGEGPEELVVVRCTAPSGGESAYLMRFASEQDASTASVRIPAEHAESCSLSTEILLPGPGTIAFTKEICEQIGGTWHLREHGPLD